MENKLEMKWNQEAVWQAVLAAVFAILVHKKNLCSGIIGIDTEDFICHGASFLDGWRNTGRQGLVFLKYIMNGDAFNPYLSGTLTILLLALAVTLTIRLWNHSYGEKCHLGIYFATMGLWVAHPIWAEQFYFMLQGAEICLGMLLSVIAVRCVEKGAAAKGRRRLGFFVTAILLLLITFSTYQIFVVYFIFLTVSFLLLKSLRTEGGKKGFRAECKRIAPYILIFLIAFIVNSLVTKLFFYQSDYLAGQIRWGELSLRDCVYSIAIHVRNVLTGQNSIFTSAVYGILCLIGLVGMFCIAGKKGIAPLFYFLCLMVTPFLMTIVCAQEPAIRSQLILPACTGLVFFVDGILINNPVRGEIRTGRMHYPLVAGMMLLAIIGVYQESDVTLRLYYTDACRYEQDVAIGRDLIKRLEQIRGGDDTPIVVIGSRSFQPNRSCMEGEIIGRSIFEHDVNEEPRYYWSTRRVVSFLHTLGYNCEQLPDRSIPYAESFAEDMGVYPAPNSVAHAGDMIVIKLSEE